MSENKITPVIILPGIGQSRVVLTDENGAPVKTAWPLDLDADALLGPLKGPAMKMMMFRRDAGFSDKVAEVIRTALDPISAKPDGTMKNRLTTVRYPVLSECSEDNKRYINRMVPTVGLTDRIGEENVWFLAYNSFGDPYETAEELDALIGKIKAERGCEKVHLLPVSMGAAVATAYFDAYGAKGDVDRAMYMVPALGGSKVVADLFKEDLEVTELCDILEIFMDAKAGEALRGFAKIMPAGVAEAVAHKALAAVRDTAIRFSPMVWSVVPPECYPALADRWLSGEETAVLRKKTDRFYAAQSRLRELLDEQRTRGTSFYICAGYGLPFPPVFGGDACSTDGIINLSCATLGAKSAAAGQPLPETEIGDPAYVSPDGEVDASFCYTPETTWFFAKQQHDAIAYNDTALCVAARVLCDPDFRDIHSDPALPQFGKAQDNRKPAAPPQSAAEEGRD